MSLCAEIHRMSEVIHAVESVVAFTAYRDPMLGAAPAIDLFVAAGRKEFSTVTTFTLGKSGWN